MLQKSLSTSSLVKQAAASVEAQGRQFGKSAFQRANSDFFGSFDSSNAPSRDQIGSVATSNSSETSTPCECAEKRHIRFDETVEQWIAVECKDNVFEDEIESGGDEDPARPSSSDSSSDDGLIMLKRKRQTGKGKEGKLRTQWVIMLWHFIIVYINYATLNYVGRLYVVRW